MKILYYKESSGNFGDDLNQFIWRDLLPASVFAIEDVVLLGIGTILNRLQAPLTETTGKRVFVLGSGAGYGQLPEGWERWNLLAVRGPLTAAMLGRPEIAAADPAILLAKTEWARDRQPKCGNIVFIPHHHSASRGPWNKVAEAAGMTYVDPRSPTDVVLEHLRNARLVVTEAMHGAIVADALRVPWIPVVIAPDLLPFKWKDWSESLELSYRPHPLPASSAREAYYHRQLVREAKASGLSDVQQLIAKGDVPSMIEDLKRRNDRPTVAATNEKSASSGVKVGICNFVRVVSRPFDSVFIERSVDALRRIAGTTPNLSDDRVLSRRLDQLQSALHTFVAAVS